MRGRLDQLARFVWSRPFWAGLILCPIGLIGIAAVQAVPMALIMLMPRDVSDISPTMTVLIFGAIAIPGIVMCLGFTLVVPALPRLLAKRAGQTVHNHLYGPVRWLYWGGCASGFFGLLLAIVLLGELFAPTAVPPSP
jgi:ABC-type spermidine/putrescine transport system permease subunit II